MNTRTQSDVPESEGKAPRRTLVERVMDVDDLVDGVGNLVLLPPWLLYQRYIRSKDAFAKILDENTLKEVAEHECGHFLMHGLNGDETSQLWMTPYSPTTTSLAGLNHGFLGTAGTKILKNTPSVILNQQKVIDRVKNILNPNSKTLLDNFDRCTPEELVRRSFMLFGGEAAMMATFAHGSKSIDDVLADVYKGESSIGDLTRVTLSLKKSERYKSRTNEIMTTVFTDISSFFANPKMKKALLILSEELFKKRNIHKDGKDITGTMKEVLAQNGFGETEWEEIKAAYEEQVQETTSKVKRIIIE